VRAQITGSLPNKVIVIGLNDPELKKLFTPKRLELLNFVIQNKGLTVTNIAGKLSRKKEAVSVDLKFLKKYNLIEMPREGRTKRPVVKFNSIQLIARSTKA